MEKLFLILLIIIIGLLIALGLYYQVKDYYNEKDPVILDLKKTIEKIHPKVNSIKIYKSTDGSYTINKRKIYLCTHDKKTGKLYNKNILTFILLHELSHVLCHEIGHTENFYKIFNQLLQKAKNMGIYDPSIPIPDDYCSL